MFAISSKGLALLGSVARNAKEHGLAGAFALIRDVLDRAFWVLERPPLKVRIRGWQLSGFLRHRSFLQGVAEEASYESYSHDLCRAALGAGLLFIDGGAHIGYYTLMAAHALPNGTVVAFEPDPYNYRALCFNLRQNNCQNVRALNKALSDAAGTVPFFQNSGTISSSLNLRSDLGPTRQVQVECTSLDRELEPCVAESVFAKLDLEGAEPRALRGMRNLVARSRSFAALVEINPNALRDAGSSTEELLSELDTLGLEVWFVDEKARRMIPMREMKSIPKGNLYCTKPAAPSIERGEG